LHCPTEEISQFWRGGGNFNHPFMTSRAPSVWLTRGVWEGWNLVVYSTQKSTEIKPEIKSEITQNFVIIEPTVYITAVTHRNQEIGLEIRLEIVSEIKKSHCKSTEIRLEFNRNQVRNHVILKTHTLHMAMSDPLD
jgi:hypothetical protein